jgi:cobalt-zinc-cadmium efflux system membrane fusion protein
MMKSQWTVGTIGILAGIALVLIWQTVSSPGGPSERAEQGGHAAEEPRGPHGGRLLSNDKLQLEVTIYESGVEPQFRVFPSSPSGTAIAPAEVALAASLTRLGGSVDRIAFTHESDYLRSTSTVEEPHSFDVTMVATYKGATETFTYRQVEGRAEIAEAALLGSGIEVATAGPAEIAPSLELPGEVIVPPSRQVEVTPRLPGVLTDLRVQLGQVVQRGEVVAVVTSRDLAEAGSAFVAATRRAEFAAVTRDREADLFKRRITAEQDLRVAQQALDVAVLDRTLAREKLLALGIEGAAIDALAMPGAASLSALDVRSPVSGAVTEQTAAEGEVVSGDRPLLTITDTSEVWVNVQVHTRDLSLVQPGRTVTVHGVGRAIQTTGRIVHVSPVVGDDTRTATARVVLANPKGEWHPGLFATVTVTLPGTKAAVAVPADALQTFRDWTVVFVRYGNTFEARPVTVGRSDGRYVEIVDGLRAGERYAARNAFAVKADVLKSGASHDH